MSRGDRGDFGHVRRQSLPEALACDLKLDRLGILADHLDHAYGAGVHAHREQVTDELFGDSGEGAESR